MTPAVELLVRSGTTFRLHEYHHNPSTASYGKEAADALGIDRARVLKTLVVTADAAFAVAAIPVSAELDLRAMAKVVRAKKAIMADRGAAERITGYVAGAISPLGQKRRLMTFIDESARAWPTVFVSGGRRGLEVELDPLDLARLTAAEIVRVARTPPGED